MKIFSKLLPNSTRNWILTGVGLLALIVFTGFIIVETTKAEVVVKDNGEKETIQTHAETVKELLDETGITYSQHDELSHNIDAPIEDGMNITYKEAQKVTVVVDDEETDYYTTRDNLQEFLNEKDISVSKHDETSHEKDATISDGMEFTVDKAFQVTINNGGEKEKAWTTGGTVGELLEENNITIDDDDKLKPAKKKAVSKDNPITVTRVEKETDVVKEKVDFQVEEREDSSLEKGKKKVISEGREGVVVKEYKITKENGEQVSRDLIDEEVEQESKNRVVAIGTKEKKQEASLRTVSSEKSNSQRNDNSKESSNSGGNVMHMNATAYTVDCVGCNGSGVTATGINLRENSKVVSVDPNVIPLGSRVWVEGYGEAVAGDTGGDIKGNRIDLHFKSKSQALNFGRKTVKVKILN
ncbi:Uncharacterized conserved protein YabE, contains G5 and tandem DUF348 domains [Lentibacillus persicus]|uniref:Uncharacterized conserved protein YabE, contains G5 and tandem DUF348 domains n=1 Tax=Lentibacillus persicus TaxID=640948 RepID=A0A1I1UPZ1_9BACI|nr:G5 and 3D domain-containing protein [Lentibacillus persicus]SFD72799.1 Uncharacterized conserved protein YabE, contains G5 and tandem DUF348 domains [Lentibacillus persicus]